MAVNRAVKVSSGLRLDKLVFDRFKELCQREKLMPGEAVQRFMQACLDAASVTAVLNAQAGGETALVKADELKLKGALSRLKVFTNAAEQKQWWVTVKDREVRIDHAVYLPAYETAVEALARTRDPELIRTAEQIMEKANHALEKITEKQRPQ